MHSLQRQTCGCFCPVLKRREKSYLQLFFDVPDQMVSERFIQGRAIHTERHLALQRGTAVLRGKTSCIPLIGTRGPGLPLGRPRPVGSRNVSLGHGLPSAQPHGPAPTRRASSSPSSPPAWARLPTLSAKRRESEFPRAPPSPPALLSHLPTSPTCVTTTRVYGPARAPGAGEGMAGARGALL